MTQTFSSKQVIAFRIKEAISVLSCRTVGYGVLDIEKAVVSISCLSKSSKHSLLLELPPFTLSPTLVALHIAFLAEFWHTLIFLVYLLCVLSNKVAYSSRYSLMDKCCFLLPNSYNILVISDRIYALSGLYFYLWHIMILHYVDNELIVIDCSMFIPFYNLRQLFWISSFSTWNLLQFLQHQTLSPRLGLWTHHPLNQV